MTVIRAATQDDYAALCVVIQELDHLHASALPDFFQSFEGPPRPLHWLIDILENLEALVLVAEGEGTIIGFLSAEVRKNPDLPMFVPRRWLLIDNVGVAEAHQGKGVGRALMQSAHEWAQARGLAEVELTVWEFNEAAIKFYEELGYQPIMRRLRKTL